MTAIQTNGLSKTFGTSVVALDDLDLDVEDGEVFGLLGPSGAGKSTTIDLLLDFLKPTAGTATVLGYDTREESLAIRERTGVLPDGATLYERLTGREHLELAREINDADEDIDGILERVGLSPEDAEWHAGWYSEGLAQRLGLGMALVGDPDLLILDEPTSGLDPTGITEMRRLIREESASGTTVLLSSHVPGRVETVCDRIGILDDGRLVATDTTEGIRVAMGVETTLHVSVDTLGDDVVETAVGLDGVTDAWTDGDRLGVSVRDGSKCDALNALEAAGVSVIDFAVEDSSLEAAYERYTIFERYTNDSDETPV